MTQFENFINQKPMAFNEIDLSRMPKAFKSIKDSFSIPKIIHIVGTNGKGTTGRFIAEILQKNKFSVGHYTSPHILKINERFWKDGDNISDKVLDDAHKVVFNLLSSNIRDNLSYFEYTTLMNLAIFQDCDWLILEAGLGGEFDATNVFPKILSVFTPIGFDHQAFLGNSIQEIASTKIRSIGKEAVISKQKYDEVLNIFDKIAKENESKIHFTYPKDGLSFIEENFETAKHSLKIIGEINIDYDISEFSRPSGRFEKVLKNIVVDVGHNLLSAERVVENMGKNFNLIYNSFEDKPYKEILQKFKPYINRVEILEIDDERIVDKKILERALKELNINYIYFNEIDKNLEYLVFGSFKVVEKFLKYKDNFLE